MWHTTYGPSKPVDEPIDPVSSSAEAGTVSVVQVLVILAMVYAAILVLAAVGFAVAAAVDWLWPGLRNPPEPDARPAKQRTDDFTPPAGYRAAGG